MKHTIKFRKAILNTTWEGKYSTIADTSIINIVYNLAKERIGFKLKELKIRERSSEFRSKVIIYSEDDLEWNKFVIEFFKAFDGYIENISIK